MIAENWVMSPLVTYLREQTTVGTGCLGRLRTLCMAMGWSGPTVRRAYESPVAGRNGFMLEDGIHMLAVSRALLGPVKSVAARCRTLKARRQLGDGTQIDSQVDSQVEDVVSISLDFDGASATLAGSWLMNPGGLFSQFHCEHGFVGADTPGWGSTHIVGQLVDEQGTQPLQLPAFLDRAPSSQDSYLIEDRAFVRSIIDDTPVLYSGRQGQRDVRIMELVDQASTERRTIDLDT